jgi:hypothetical protein
VGAKAGTSTTTFPLPRSRLAERANASWARIADKGASEDSLAELQGVIRSAKASTDAAALFLDKGDSAQLEEDRQLSARREQEQEARKQRALDLLGDQVNTLTLGSTLLC